MKLRLAVLILIALAVPTHAQYQPTFPGNGYTTTPSQVQPTFQTKRPTAQTDMYGRPTPPPGTDMYGRPPPPTTDNYGRALPPAGMYGR
jgi:hypothetical protein